MCSKASTDTRPCANFSRYRCALLRGSGCFADADLIVSDCLRREPHPSHAHLAMATELKAKTKARRMVLTHLDKSMDYASLALEVPKGIVVGYDGLEMSL